MSKPLAIIVEDDPKLGQVFSLTLQTAEFETELIADGNLAWVRLAEVIPTLIILDLHLPGLSGQNLLLRIRADDRLASTRVILATADALLADHFRQQSDLVLLKPISPAQLRDLALRLDSAL
jgi:DNA-binding response OmpR family regulator